MKRLIILFLACFLAGSASAQKLSKKTQLRFEATIARALVSGTQRGRLFVILSREAEREPRFSLGKVAFDAPPLFGVDVEKFEPGKSVIVVDQRAAFFPFKQLADLPPGEYYVQAVFDTNIDLRSVNAPGNLYSAVQKVYLDPKRARSLKLELSNRVPDETLPPETEYVKYVRIQSKMLSEFHGRPIFLRAGVILPRDYERDPKRRYPVQIRIGGYGAKYTRVGSLMEEKSDFRRTWLSDEAPRMILIHLDGDGPYGDAYQINSANNGPYGDAVTGELIPFIERKFRAVGKPYARVLTGGSTGGWVSLALQIFYPDYFNGTWSGFPDSLDFRAHQLIDVYKDDNAYLNQYGFERPSARTLLGDTEFTVRMECQLENVLGAGGSYTMSGGQWGAWNAVFSPRGADGRPVPLWDAESGKINRQVAAAWEKYDLRLIVERNWKTLAPKLKGKLHVWVGEADEYFLNNGVHLFDEFISRADPSFQGYVLYGSGKGHGWMPKSDLEIMREMMSAIEKGE